MRKWRSLANPCDSSAWLDMNGMWPTGRGSYECCDQHTSLNTATASGEIGQCVSAWCFRTLGAARSYYIGKYLWEYVASTNTATDRTGALGANTVSATTGGHACQYGDITIIARGTSANLISSSGGNFASIAGAPSARFVVTQSNCVVAFNTSANADEWVASDVGDYTNWTTGEAASGRILENNGAITGACAFGNDILVFKGDSIFRMTYVGGTIKWQIQPVWRGVGLYDTAVAGGSACVATSRGVFFCGGYSNFAGDYKYYLFDGASPPRCVNMEKVLNGQVGIPVYNPKTEMVSVYTYDSVTGKNYLYYYNLLDDAWGGSDAAIRDSSDDSKAVPFRGGSHALAYDMAGSETTVPYAAGSVSSAVDAFYVYRSLSGPGSTTNSAFVKTHKYTGQQDGVFGRKQFTFGPASAVLRRRSAYSAGSPSLALTVNTYQEAHDTTAAATASVTESTLRDRFDFTKEDSFCELKLTITDTDVEIDDIAMEVKPAGAR